VASIYRPKIIRYLMPDGSSRTPDGRHVTKNTPGAVRVVTESSVLRGRYKDGDGVWHDVALSENKTTAKAMLAELAHESRLDELGIERPDVTDPFAAHRARPLAEHLDDFAAALVARGDTADHVGRTVAQVRAVLDGCGFKALDDLDAQPVNDWLAAQRADQAPVELPVGVLEFTPREVAKLLGLKPLSVTKAVWRHRLAATGAGRKRRYPRETVQALAEMQARGSSPETVNHYVRAVRSFCRWLVKNRRLPFNPLETVALVNTASDRRHDRRELEADELRRLLAATLASNTSFRGLGPADRHALYAAACGTGFRAGALASLAPEAFDLDGDTPVVVLAARRNKSRKQRTQPLPADVADLLRAWLVGKEQGKPVWWGSGIGGPPR
jgi:excisionase family DNA binding protein